MNQFGEKFRVAIFGESHGPQIGIVIDGVKAGMPLSVDDFAVDLDRRRSGARGTTMRKESDIPKFASGIFEGHTTGAPLTIIFDNEDTRSGDYTNLLTHPRPSHSDLVARQKWDGANDPRGGGHFSGRITTPLVSAGVVAKKVLGSKVKIEARLLEVGGRPASQSAEVIEAAMRRSDSVGGLIECRVSGLEAGFGGPFFDSLESVISHAIFSVPAVRAIEFGMGFKAAAMFGSEHNDMILNAKGETLTNNAGGIVGGISNGNEIVFRVAIKPTASISMAQQTYNFATDRVDELKIKGRHDSCIALRASVVIEAATALALAQF